MLDDTIEMQKLVNEYEKIRSKELENKRDTLLFGILIVAVLIFACFCAYCISKNSVAESKRQNALDIARCNQHTARIRLLMKLDNVPMSVLKEEEKADFLR